MRKKLKMRAGGPIKKYAEGGTIRGRGISQGLRGARASQPRVQEAERAMAAQEEEDNKPIAAGAPRQSLISNNPVGTNIARGRIPVGATRIEDSADATKPIETAAPEEVLPMPPVPPVRAPRRRVMAPRRQRGLSEADMLNERSLEAARAGRNMYRKGGKVK